MKIYVTLVGVLILLSERFVHAFQCFTPKGMVVYNEKVKFSLGKEVMDYTEKNIHTPNKYDKFVNRNEVVKNKLITLMRSCFVGIGIITNSAQIVFASSQDDVVSTIPTNGATVIISNDQATNTALGKKVNILQSLDIKIPSLSLPIDDLPLPPLPKLSLPTAEEREEIEKERKIKYEQYLENKRIKDIQAQEDAKRQKEIEIQRKEEYEQMRRKVEEEKQANIREYEDKFRKTQEERDRYYGEMALRKRQELKDAQAQEVSSVQGGVFQNFLPPSSPSDKLGNNSERISGDSSELNKSKTDHDSLEKIVTNQDNGIIVEQKDENAMTSSEAESKPTSAYTDKLARKEANLQKKKKEFDEQMELIRIQRKEEQDIVQKRAELNALKVKEAKEKIAKEKAAKAQDLEMKQRLKFVEAREARENAAFEQELQSLDKYFMRKEKMANIEVQSVVEPKETN